MGKNQWVVPTTDGWGIRGEGNERLTRRTETQREAIDIATEIARNQHSELIVQRESGQIRERNSYGDDPFPPRDKD
jgi:hypothetical protein